MEERLDFLEGELGGVFKELRKLRSLVKVLTEENKELKDKLNQESYEEKQEIGFFIKSQRLNMNKSVKDFAAMFAVTYHSLYNYEKGIGSLKSMEELAEMIKEVRKRG